MKIVVLFVELNCVSLRLMYVDCCNVFCWFCHAQTQNFAVFRHVLNTFQNVPNVFQTPHVRCATNLCLIWARQGAWRMKRVARSERIERMAATFKALSIIARWLETIYLYFIHISFLFFKKKCIMCTCCLVCLRAVFSKKQRIRKT